MGQLQNPELFYNSSDALICTPPKFTYTSPCSSPDNFTMDLDSKIVQFCRYCEEQNNDKGTTMKMADYVHKCAVPGFEMDVGTFHTHPKELNCQQLDVHLEQDP